MTIYANVVNVRSAGKDVVLEFGSFFPDSDQQFPPKGHRPELRVVMSSDLLVRLATATTLILLPPPLARWLALTHSPGRWAVDALAALRSCCRRTSSLARSLERPA
jgi:hypothetical protein